LRSDAFTSPAQRPAAPEITAFVSALTQADRLGVPTGGVLREQSEQLRIRRRQRAEKKAQKVPIKILFPVPVCSFPVFFIVVIGPGAIRIVQTFSRG
jgi:tight adherence protein C